MKRVLLLLCGLTAAFLVVDLLAQGPITNALNLKVRTDASNYLIVTTSAYTGPDGPATNFGNQRLRTDSNNYLLVTFNGAQTFPGNINVTGNVVATGSVTGSPFISSGGSMAVANVGANSCGTTSATIAGNSNAFVITSGTVSVTQCRVAFPVAATTEYDCTGSDSTTTTAVRTTPVDTTHTDFLGSFTAGDKITGICFPR